MEKSLKGYQFIKKLHSGEFSQVYLVQKNGKDYAFKILQESSGFTWERNVNLFRHEYWILKNCSHKNIVQVEEYGQLEDGRLYIVEEYLHAENLIEYIKNKTRKVREEICLQLLEAVSYLQNWKIIHRNLKPDKILIMEEAGRPIVKVLDFGFSHHIKQSKKNEYDSPEVILGQAWTYASDVYSLGLIIYQILIDQELLLDKADRPLKEILNQQLIDYKLMEKTLGEPWKKAVEYSVEKNKNQRIQKVEDLKKFVTEKKLPIYPSSYVERNDEKSKILDFLDKNIDEEKLAVIVSGEDGLGKSRLLEEVCFEFLIKHPELRNEISIHDYSEKNKKILLLEDSSEVPGYKTLYVKLNHLNENTLNEILKQTLGISLIPSEFLKTALSITAGYPHRVMDLLDYLKLKSLDDFSSKEKKEKLLNEIIWQEYFPEFNKEFNIYKDYDFILYKLRNKLKKKQLLYSDQLWSFVEKLVLESKDPLKILKRRAEVLLIEGESLMHQGILERAKENLSTALELIKNIPDMALNKYIIENDMAYMHLLEEKIQDAVLIYESVWEECLESISENQRHLITNMNLGTAYLKQKDFDKAITQIKTEIEILKKNEDQKQLFELKNNLAEALLGKEKIEDAKKQYLQLLMESKIKFQPYYILLSFRGLANVYEIESNRGLALEYYEKANEAAQALGENLFVSELSLKKGVIEQESGKLEEAEETFDFGIKSIEKITKKTADQQEVLCDIFCKKAQLSMARQNFKEAEEYFLKSWDAIKENSALDEKRVDILKQRSKLWLKTQDSKKLKEDLETLKLYVKDEINTEEFGSFKVDFENKSKKTEKVYTDEDLQTSTIINELRNRISHLENELSALKSGLLEKNDKKQIKEKIFPTKEMIIKSKTMENVFGQGKSVANSLVSVLICGESGTGKEYLAQYIHENSNRSGKFVSIHCAALPPNMMEKELFGYDKEGDNGFTNHIGLIESANQGTLYLEEVSELPLNIQVKLLKVLREKSLIRLGNHIKRNVDFRVIVSSSKNLLSFVNKKQFSKELYYKCAEFEIHVPPLRDHREDLIHLALNFLKGFRNDNNKIQLESFSKEVLDLMTNYSWPGNMNELKSFIEISTMLCQEKKLFKKHLPAYLLNRFDQNRSYKRSFKREEFVGWYNPTLTWKEHELLIYLSALNEFDFDAVKTADSLGVGVATVYKWIREHQLKKVDPEWKKRVLPYQKGIRLKDLRKYVFQQAKKRHQGHPYHAADELNVAPVTFYRWVKEERGK